MRTRAYGLSALVPLSFVVAAVSAGCSTAPGQPTPQAVQRQAALATDPGARDCAPTPSRCGYPDGTTAGVDARTEMRVVTGPLVIDTTGAVVEDVEVHGSIEVEASDVTLRNVRVVTDGDGWAIALRHVSGTTIEDCEVAPKRFLLVGIKDIYGDAVNTTIRACDIARTTTGVQIYAGVVEDNFIHDLAIRPGDHVNGIMSTGGTSPLLVRHNTVINPHAQTDAIGLFQDFGVEANRTITDNFLSGGSWTIYGGAGDKGQSSSILISNNRFSRTRFPAGGDFGPVAHFDPSGKGNVWSGNVWDDTGEEVPAP